MAINRQAGAVEVIAAGDVAAAVMPRLQGRADRSLEAGFMCLSVPRSNCCAPEKANSSHWTEIFFWKSYVHAK